MDELERDTRDVLDAANEAVNKCADSGKGWLFDTPAALLHYQATVHVGKRFDEYRKARIALHRAIRGLRRALRSVHEDKT